MVGDLLASAGHGAQSLNGVDRITIARGDLGAASAYLVDVLQLQQAERRLHFVHLAVDANGNDAGLAGKTEVLQIVDVPLGLGVRTDDGTTFEGGEDLGGMEAQPGQVAMHDDATVVALDAKSMGRVVDDLKIVGIGDALDGVDVAGVAITVHRENGGSLRCDSGLDLVWIKVECPRLDVDEHGGDVVPKQGMGGGDEGVRGGDDLTGDAQGLERGYQRQGTVGKEREMLDAQILAQRLLQLAVEGAAVGEDLAVPNLPQERDKVLKRRQVGPGNVDGLVGHASGSEFMRKDPTAGLTNLPQ